MAPSYPTCFLLLLSFWALRALAQAPADPLKDFCRRYGHQTAIIDRKLYIDGGWLYANPISRNPTPVINRGLLYNDLDEISDGMPKQHANLTKNSSVPAVAGGTLWEDEVNKVFWLYGGEFQSAPSPFELWGYDVILNQWNLSDAGTAATSPIQRVSYGAGVSVNDIGRGYYYGGYLNNLTNPLWNGPQIATSNLIIFDMEDHKLTNNTGYDNMGRAEGTMVYIPASGAGLLVYFGGVTFPYGNETAVAAPLDTILIYDIGDASWHSQAATGEIPEQRRKFCGGATWAQDRSSYQVYIYGGFGFAENATGFDDVYVLTMPAFEWVKWYPEKPGPGAPHGLLTCNVIENSQMMVMGGNFTNTTECDVPKIQGQHNLNLGQYNRDNAKWFQYLPNVTEYLVPPEILQITGGSPRGGATKKSPSNGWDDNRVATYFGQLAPNSSRTPTRAIPTQTAIPVVPVTPPSKKRNIGAIVGGAVGGVAVLAFAAGLIFFFLRRRRSNQQPQPTPVPTATDYSSVQSPISKYATESKFTVVDPNYTTPVLSPNLSSHSPVHSNAHSQPYSTPPPVQTTQPMYHPAHAPEPIEYYPPPDGSRPNLAHLGSSEMPTIRSPP
ncbi:hypothetical protein EPUS_00584 [Endocarpon pusillum Z07020]|uniref:Kelch repeat-containing protein n=1 Tax=Endocarpon pusillum (strain Z07020 / HMAS-L-300199) TaxID=1263415 RepID=U1HMQ3_ENDPU|nr:uncharacterized protein EPUS_00584 [Endocarpon pusillum Z07020]ERF71595.1 hypothetical protein EPUS_00584 [Endocarpon pusillum Z07020]